MDGWTDRDSTQPALTGGREGGGRRQKKALSDIRPIRRRGQALNDVGVSLLMRTFAIEVIFERAEIAIHFFRCVPEAASRSSIHRRLRLSVKTLLDP